MWLWRQPSVLAQPIAAPMLPLFMLAVRLPCHSRQNELAASASSSRRVAASGKALLSALQAQLSQLAASGEEEGPSADDDDATC